MNKNPYINASLATIYIVGLVSLINLVGAEEHAIGIGMPIIMLSFFVLSAAIMGYLFIGTPLQLYLDGQKKEAVSFFFKTIGVFALITICLSVAIIIAVK